MRYLYILFFTFFIFQNAFCIDTLQSIHVPSRADRSRPVPTKIKRVYLIHGLGADGRLFKNIKLDSSFEVRYVILKVPEKSENMKTYAQRTLLQIDTTKPFALVGVSFGGMVATEISQLVHVEKVVIISSAGTRSELPPRYRFMRRFPVYKLIPGWFMKASSFVMQPLFEPDRRKEKTTCNAMLYDKNPLFLKNATRLIINWLRTEKPSEIIHIHGTNDHTIPYKNINANHIIQGGSHMMTLTCADEINVLLDKILLM